MWAEDADEQLSQLLRTRVGIPQPSLPPIVVVSSKFPGRSLAQVLYQFYAAHHCQLFSRFVYSRGVLPMPALQFLATEVVGCLKLYREALVHGTGKLTEQFDYNLTRFLGYESEPDEKRLYKVWLLLGKCENAGPAEAPNNFAFKDTVADQLVEMEPLLEKLRGRTN